MCYYLKSSCMLPQLPYKIRASDTSESSYLPPSTAIYNFPSQVKRQKKLPEFAAISKFYLINTLCLYSSPLQSLFKSSLNNGPGLIPVQNSVLYALASSRAPQAILLFLLICNSNQQEAQTELKNTPYNLKR